MVRLIRRRKLHTKPFDARSLTVVVLVSAIAFLEIFGFVRERQQLFGVEVAIGSLVASISNSSKIHLDLQDSLPTTAASTKGEDAQDANKNISNAPFLPEMAKLQMRLSARHQEKFHRNKDLLASNFPEDVLYSMDPFTKQFYAFNLNPQFAFRHIYKNGGTTVERQTGLTRSTPEQVGNRTIVATVRDPIDHWLAGWQECGFRLPKVMGKYNQTLDYDSRIRQWLWEVDHSIQQTVFQKGPCERQRLCTCALHSVPQANFLIGVNDDGGTLLFDPRVTLIGDLQELPELFRLVGLEYNTSMDAGNQASQNVAKVDYFPKKKHLLSNATLQRICQFVRVDYFLFDFEMPETCRQT
ncbi:expressed unknown protein [Seminavis robusta]|uniref:Sulfotransferase n=1 Tax=Seminavis robusta TaxID=568900 RepID=A0A9N8EQU9_9STRA|nr:expressed unknown protein [Seminavis robusta]|eukprot:Sro1437_g272540.1 n/a (355) ;mRNA; r:12753-13817